MSLTEILNTPVSPRHPGPAIPSKVARAYSGSRLILYPGADTISSGIWHRDEQKRLVQHPSISSDAQEFCISRQVICWAIRAGRIQPIEVPTGSRPQRELTRAELERYRAAGSCPGSPPPKPASRLPGWWGSFGGLLGVGAGGEKPPNPGLN